MAFIKFGVRELCKWHFWASCLAECLATCLFVFLTTGTTITWNKFSPPSTEMIALSFGLSIATLAMAILHLSGGHINPAVSIAMLASGRVPVLRGIFFVIFQLGGGIGGSAMLYGLTPSQKRGTLGATQPAEDVTRYQALGIEAVLTFLLVFTVFASTDPKRHHYGYEVPLAIGFCVSVCHFIGIGFTGCGINPARSLGPAVIMNIWTHHWVYWAGPIGGGLIAALLYELLFRAREHQGPGGGASEHQRSVQMPELKELTTKRFWIELAAEFLGTIFLTIGACGSSLTWDERFPPTIIHTAFTSACAVSTGIMIIGHVSGGQFNPAVSLAMLTARKLSFLRWIGYVIAQVAGAIAGAGILYGLTPAGVIGSLGVTTPSGNVNLGQAIGVELMMTFVLIISIFAASDEKRNFQGYEAAMSTGVVVFICSMLGIPYTGASLNPARSFGPAFVMNSWKDHWVYWLAPISGGLLAAFIYESLFSLKRLQRDNEDIEHGGISMSSIDHKAMQPDPADQASDA